MLKWHKEGCYAVAFADVGVGTGEGEDKSVDDREQTGMIEVGNQERAVLQTKEKETRLSFRQRRIQRAEETNWLAVGSKDGKVSLWDVY